MEIRCNNVALKIPEGSTLENVPIWLLVLYFLPFLAAAARRHQNTLAIFVLDLLLGWTLLGWVVAMVWAFTEIKEREHKGILGFIPNIKRKPKTIEISEVDRELFESTRKPKPKELVASNIDVAEKIKQLHELRKENAISDEEYERLKARLLE